MRLEIIRCDTCGKEHDARRTLPPEWLTVSRTGDLRPTGKYTQVPATLNGNIATTFYRPEFVMADNATLHFCCQFCLVQWALSKENGSAEEI